MHIYKIHDNKPLTTIIALMVFASIIIIYITQTLWINFVCLLICWHIIFMYTHMDTQIFAVVIFLDSIETNSGCVTQLSMNNRDH